MASTSTRLLVANTSIIANISLVDRVMIPTFGLVRREVRLVPCKVASLDYLR